ncbi:hypothetical protein ARTHRO9AX_80126 [Arthrobacter sp. 9AX]|nr:hypothetical protein ARTHRO9AX_80126 [Arthrobacter sp. 9AX]
MRGSISSRYVVRDEERAGTTARRKAAGRAQEVLALRLGLMAPFAPPPFVLVTTADDILELLLVGALCIVAALAGGHFLTSRAGVPTESNRVMSPSSRRPGTWPATSWACSAPSSSWNAPRRWACRGW